MALVLLYTKSGSCVYIIIDRHAGESTTTTTMVLLLLLFLAVVELHVKGFISSSSRTLLHAGKKCLLVVHAGLCRAPAALFVDGGAIIIDNNTNNGRRTVSSSGVVGGGGMAHFDDDEGVGGFAAIIIGRRTNKTCKIF